MLSIFLDYIYSTECLVCGIKRKNYLCKRCEKSLEKYYENKIDRYNDKYFNIHLYNFKYTGKIRDLLIDYKFNDKPYLYEIFVKFMLKNEKMCRFFETYDIIIPVPIHNKRKAQRGYNQSALITRKIAKKYKLSNEENVLKKVKNNVQQSKLTKEQRIINAKNVYKINNKEKIINKNIIIVDDIYTTGSTANECAKILKQNGAKKIIVITVAKD